VTEGEVGGEEHGGGEEERERERAKGPGRGEKGEGGSEGTGGVWGRDWGSVAGRWV